MKARKHHHFVSDLLVKDTQRHVKVFEFDRLTVLWQLEINEAPSGESLSGKNDQGTRLYINKTKEKTMVSPVSSGQTYLDSAFTII